MLCLTWKFFNCANTSLKDSLESQKLLLFYGLFFFNDQFIQDQLLLRNISIMFSKNKH